MGMSIMGMSIMGMPNGHSHSHGHGVEHEGIPIPFYSMPLTLESAIPSKCMQTLVRAKVFDKTQLYIGFFNYGN